MYVTPTEQILIAPFFLLQNAKKHEKKPGERRNSDRRRCIGARRKVAEIRCNMAKMACEKQTKFIYRTLKSVTETHIIPTKRLTVIVLPKEVGPDHVDSSLKLSDYGDASDVIGDAVP